LHERGTEKLVVEQLKSRPSGSTGSLQEVIREVLPDLYLAHDGHADGTEYRFVTEGRMGVWADVYFFFQRLRERPRPMGNVLSALDDNTPLRFQRGQANANEEKPAFWDESRYTERSLFSKIVQEVRRRPTIASKELEQETCHELFDVLAHFTFVPEQTAEKFRAEVDAIRLSVVHAAEDVHSVRGQLLADLAEKAANLPGFLFRVQSDAIFVETLAWSARSLGLTCEDV
jgi:hypothetical protein